MRGIIAASLYENLDEADERRLDAHLAACEACRREAQSLGLLVSRLAPQPVAFQGDLRPVLRESLRAARSGSLWFRPAVFGAVCLSVVVAGFFTAVILQPASSPRREMARLLTPMEQALAASRELSGDGRYAEAYKVLSTAVSEHPEAPLAGQAQRQLADLAFANLHWYPEAYEAYQNLAQKYFDVYSADDESKLRNELLDEARQVDFASLYELDAARQGLGDTFAQLEQVVARYPGTYVASSGVREMAQLVVAEKGLGEDDAGLARGLELARARTSNAAVVAQMTMALGDLYWHRLADYDRARTLFDEVANGDHEVLAQRAQTSLRQLDSE